MLRSAIVLQLMVLAGGVAGAQQIGHQEVTLGAVGSTDTPSGGTPSAGYGQYRIPLTGPIVRYSFNVNRAFAVESSVTDSVDAVAQSDHEGGHQLLALAGVKVGIRRRWFGVYGTSEAGVASFSNTLQADGLAPPQFGHTTHFALQQGVAVEFYPKPRTFLRFDFDELLMAEFSRVYFALPGISQVSYGVVPYHASISLTVGHRFGALKELETPEPSSHKPRYSVGGLFAMEMREHLLEEQVRAEGGGGAWVGIPLWRFLSADIIAYDHPHDDHTANVQDGGTTFASFAGPKMGFRLGQFGFYAKARPGIMRFSRTNFAQGFTEDSLHHLVPTAYDRPTIDFALDIGGVFEYTPAARGLKHMVVRFEGGSTYIHYHGSDLTVRQYPGLGLQPAPDGTVYYFPPQRHSSMLFLTGVGFTF
jgi:hypothetical protein